MVDVEVEEVVVVVTVDCSEAVDDERSAIRPANKDPRIMEAPLTIDHSQPEVTSQTKKSPGIGTSIVV